MKSELSDEVVDQIVFGMENQDEDYYFDREKEVLVKAEDLSGETPEDSRRYVPIPQWRPVDGFHMMEQFTAGVKNPIYREELRDTLKGGRGVFRRFKDLLKRHEPLERLWFNFKENEMRRIVRRWYGRITEAENMEELGEEPEETEEILLSDLDIRDREESTEEVMRKIERALTEALYDVSGEIRELVIDEKLAAYEESQGYTVEAFSLNGDLVASAGGELFTSEAGDVLKVLYLYVEPEFRGMGLSRLLIDRITETAKRLEVKEMAVDIPSGSSFLERELAERGFNEYLRSYSLRWSNFD